MGSARGVLVTAAKRIGCPPADYAARVVAGEKWCIGCKAWHDIDVFGQDGSRPDGRAAMCRATRGRLDRARYARRRTG